MTKTLLRLNTKSTNQKGCLFLSSLLGENLLPSMSLNYGHMDEQYKALEWSSSLGTIWSLFWSFAREKEICLVSKEENYLQELVRSFAAGGETFEILDNADMAPTVHDKGEEVQLTHGNHIFGRIKDQSRSCKEAYEGASYKVYEQYQHTYAKNLGKPMKSSQLQCHVCKFSSACEAALLENFVPESVYDSLVAAVIKHLPLLQRCYVQLRSKFLEFQTWRCTICIRHYPIQTTSLPMKNHNKAEEVLAVFGEDYLRKTSLQSNGGLMHVNQGKRSGAAQVVLMIPMPSCCWTGGHTLDNLFTLVHETGHSMHSSYTREPSLMSMGTIPSSPCRNRLYNQWKYPDRTSEEVEDDATLPLRFWITWWFPCELSLSNPACWIWSMLSMLRPASCKIWLSEFLNNLLCRAQWKILWSSKEDNPEIQYEWALTSLLL